jgi:branched-chain amino acid transport system substrate-binding protein
MTVTRRQLLVAAGGAPLTAPSLLPRTPPSALPPLDPNGPVMLTLVLELTGRDARAGDDWRNGVEMAVQTVNAAGGLLGRTLQTSTYDGVAATARATTLRALERGPYALLGPVRTDAARQALAATRGLRILHVLGGDDIDLASHGHPGSFRPTLGRAGGLQRLGAWSAAEVQPHRIAVVSESGDSGRSARDLLLRALQPARAELVADITVSAGQGPGPADTAGAVSALARAPVDAAFVLLSESDCLRLLREAARQSLRVPLLGERALASLGVLARAGAAADGVRCHEALSAAAPVPEIATFAGAFTERYHATPSLDVMKGYAAVMMVCAGTARMGSTDRAGLPEALRNASLGIRDGMLVETRWNAAGEADHASFIVTAQAGAQAWMATLPGR